MRIVCLTQRACWTRRASVGRSRRVVARGGQIDNGVVATVAIGDVFDSYIHSLAPAFRALPPNVAEENLQARVRGNFLMSSMERVR